MPIFLFSSHQAGRTRRKYEAKTPVRGIWLGGAPDCQLILTQRSPKFLRSFLSLPIRLPPVFTVNAVDMTPPRQAALSVCRPGKVLKCLDQVTTGVTGCNWVFFNVLAAGIDLWVLGTFDAKQEVGSETFADA